MQRWRLDPSRRRWASGCAACAASAACHSASCRARVSPYAYISRIEAGARRPSVKALRLLARKLKVSPEYLERGSDLRETDERELELAEAELQVRLGEDGERG